MSVTSKMYGNSLLKALSKEINYLSDTIKVMLCTSTYIPDQDAHIYKSSISGEVTGTGYTAGGIILANKTMTYDSVTNTIKLDADDITWATSTITARYAIIYDATGTDSTSALLGYVDFGADQTSSSGNFVITWDATGIFAVTAG